MDPFRIGWRRCAGTAAAGLLTVIAAFAADEPQAPSAEQRAAHLARMRELAASIHVYATPERTNAPVPLVQEPVLRYSDRTRRLHESSLWIWGNGGRPTAIAAIEYYPNRRRSPKWLYEIASLSTGRIAVERGTELNWTATQPGLVLRAIDGNEPATASSVRRLSQMRELSRRFEARETAVVGGEIELRPLTSPLYRYHDAAGGLIDGAVFAFANGTNPEVLLVLEAHGSKGSPATWHYGLVQMTGAAVGVMLDGTEIWKRGEADPPSTRPGYVNGWMGLDAPSQ